MDTKTWAKENALKEAIKLTHTAISAAPHGFVGNPDVVNKFTATVYRSLTKLYEEIDGNEPEEMEVVIA